uniref:Uncharacterized protein n=2 Tax=Davidia involucrata TaxID=16924 RepID=A0A5B7B9F9_DAVIN
MKSMEGMWQKQIATLQMSLDAVKKSLPADNTAGQPGRLGGSPLPRYYDSEDTMSMGSQTPGGTTPIKFSSNVRDVGVGREINGGLDTVSLLVKEFEQRKQNFDDEAKAIVEVKSVEELRKLKLRFRTWKKDYKVRLRETNAKLHKLGLSEMKKIPWKWWGMKNKRVT